MTSAETAVRPRRLLRKPAERAAKSESTLLRLAPLFVFVGVIGLWYFVSMVLLDADRRFLLPPPHEVVDIALLDWFNLRRLLRGLWLSTSVALLGLVLSIVIGMVLAITMCQARWVERSVYPYAVVLQTIPTLALVPLIGLWLDYGFVSRVVVCVLVAIFPIISGTLFGLQSVDQGMHDLFTLNGASPLTRLVKLQLPAGLPSIFTGFQVSAGLSVVGAVVGDVFFKQGSPGIGALIDLYRARLQTQEMFAAAILASLLGVLVFTLFGWLSRAVTGKWYGAGGS